ncbi:MAG TPA: hypothetical protein VNW51_01580, partial [Mucilaginibacter sp.]|nr:hypothetical protein [Mucilaginibacter sp.]
TSGLGIVQEGILNRQVKVVAKEPLQVQFDNILKSLNNESAKPGELIIQLRQLAFSELTSSFSEHGYFGFGATLYAKKGDMYLPIQSIDTLAIVSAMDVTKKNIQNGSEIIAKFLSESLPKVPNETNGYTYNDLINFADITKNTLRLYNSDVYVDGYYLNYKSFSNQAPDGQIVLDGKELKPGNIKATDAKGKLKKLKSETIYAMVYNGKPFISTPSGFYPVSKSNGDFFFTGKLSNPRNNNAAAMGSMYGAIGGALFGAMTAANDINPTFDVKIYYLTGDFIRIREVKEEKAKGRAE